MLKLMNQRVVRWSLLLLCLLFLSVAPLFSEELSSENGGASALAPDPVLLRQSVYNFSEHLMNAEATTYFYDKTPITGNWQQNHFVFAGLASKTDIRLITPFSPQGASSMIWNPLEKAARQLTFYDVPSGGNKLIVRYRLTQEKKTKENNYLSLTVWAGSHRLRRMRLSLAPPGEWQKEVFDLKETTFLNRQVPITFEIGTDFSGLLNFFFTADIQK